MRKEENKELEEAVKILKEIQEMNRAWLMQTIEENCEKIYLRDIEAIETVLKEIERLQEESIEKDKIRHKIKELQNMKVEEEVFITAKKFAMSILEELLEEE